MKQKKTYYYYKLCYFLQLAMINIQCKLEEWSEESIRKSNNTSSNHVVSIRQKRTCPGAGLYRRLDDVRLILQVT